MIFLNFFAVSGVKPSASPVRMHLTVEPYTQFLFDKDFFLNEKNKTKQKNLFPKFPKPSLWQLPLISGDPLAPVTASQGCKTSDTGTLPNSFQKSLVPHSHAILPSAQ